MAEYLSPEEKKRERLLRMRAMAERLFQDEIKPKKKPLPQIKLKGPVVVASFFAVLLLVFTILYRVNKFIYLEENVNGATAAVEVAVERRANLFDNIVNAALNQAALEYELVQHVADSRANRQQTGQLQAAEENLNKLKNLKSDLVTESSLAKLFALVEQYPEIRFSDTYSELMDNLVEIESTIMERRYFLNKETQVYNSTISQFPWQMLATLFKFFHYDYYEIKDRADALVPHLEPSMFKSLMPEKTGSPGN
ncbi:MAG: LemA family protein [SAR324 cluster bacterium]|nr:LemA family protein [SAR324 cluster bacterium]